MSLNSGLMTLNIRYVILPFALGAVTTATNAQFMSNSSNFPPAGGTFQTPVGVDPVITFGGTSNRLRNLRLINPTGGVPPPPLGGGSLVINSFFDIFTEISFDSGATWHPSSHPSNPVDISIMQTQPSGGSTFFDTEMLSMTLVNVGFSGCMIRESPTRASTGRTRMQDMGGGQWAIDSFFDVFTELSVDGGQTWTPATNPQRLGLVPEPATMAILGLGVLPFLRRKSKRK